MDSSEPLIEETQGFWSSIWNHGWKPTSNELLCSSEQKILKGIKGKYEQFFVKVDGHNINTLKMGNGSPLLMVHGFGGGIGLWIGNLDTLAQHHTVYAIDLIGFGRSSRPSFVGSEPEEAEQFFLDGIENWRKAVGLKKFNLLGHSLGAYITACYALKKPKKIEKLILADPWGVPKKPDEENTNDYPLKWKVALQVLKLVPSPLSLLRAAGPYGPSMINRVRPDLSAKFSHLFDEPDVLSKYIYHCNAQNPSGETAFEKMQIPWGWAKLPLVERLHNIDENVPISFIYGKKTWMDYNAAFTVLPQMKGNVEFVLIPEAGHHVYIDNANDFNKAVILTCKNSLYQLPLQDPRIEFHQKTK